MLLFLFVTSSQAYWIQLDPIPYPDVIGPGGGITYGGEYIWVIIGNDEDVFYAYDIEEDEWIETLEELPECIYDAGAITYESGINRRIFVAASIEDETDQLFVYTKDRTTGYEGAWNDPDETKPIYLPAECGPGVSLAYEPVSDHGILIGGWLYLLLGYNYDNSKQFYRLFFQIPDTSGGTRGVNFDASWDRLDDIPTDVNAGGALCYDAYSKSLFALVGGGNPYIYRYDLNSETWDESPNGTPLNANDGSSIVAGPPASPWSRLAAVFGWSEDIEKHRVCYFQPPYYYNWWISGDDLPDILGSGASLAYEPRADDLYLVIGDEKSDFYYNPDPWYTPEGPQAQKTIDLSQKTKISYDFNKLVIHYSTNAATQVEIQIYDLMGKRIKMLFSDNVEKGEHSVTWNKTNNSNHKVANGVYFITIEKESRPEGVKVIIR
jgi:hypothetical protein